MVFILYVHGSDQRTSSDRLVLLVYQHVETEEFRLFLQKNNVVEAFELRRKSLGLKNEEKVVSVGFYMEL